MKYLYVLLLPCLLLAQTQYDGLNKYNIYNLTQENVSYTPLVGDESPPDVFDTPPVVTFTAPDAITISWRHSEIDSADFKEIRFAWSLAEDNSSGTLIVPRATSASDSDTTIIIPANYVYGANDTTDTFTVITSVFDSSSNSQSMTAINRTMQIYWEHPLPIDSIYFADNYDSVYVRYTPSARQTTNSAWLLPAGQIYQNWWQLIIGDCGTEFAQVWLDSIIVDSVMGYEISTGTYCSTPNSLDTIRLNNWVRIYRDWGVLWDSNDNAFDSDANQNYYLIYPGNTDLVVFDYTFLK